MIFTPRSIKDSPNIRTGMVGWRSPSNIALVKYWGKYGTQQPRNPSISFTLDGTFSETIINFEVSEYESPNAQLDFYFEGKPNEAFKYRIEKFLNTQLEHLPFLKRTHLSIESQNSFPHSSGIASSASSMSSLAMCLLEIEDMILDSETQSDVFLKRASYISRLASGSACRSVYPDLAIWGETSIDNTSSNDFAIPFMDAHEVYNEFHDDILIVSDKEKKVSSTAGHQLMESNVYAENRYKQARERLSNIKGHLVSGDLMAFGKIVEDEALTLHALMMASDPSYILLEPNTLKVINKIRGFRANDKLPVFFTLDAGPNVHVLYPHKDSDKIREFIDAELRPYCLDGRIIRDQTGKGPIRIQRFADI